MADTAPNSEVLVADRYVIQRELGRGGMATVYLAHDRKQRRLVAPKVIRPDRAPALGTERFVREIEITSRLPHPHILPLYDSGVLPLNGARATALPAEQHRFVSGRDAYRDVEGELSEDAAPASALRGLY